MRRLVIVGGGIAGLSLATRLGRRFRGSGEVQVTLVDRSFAHVWKPMLHTLASGTANAYQERIPFLSHGARAGFSFLPGPLAGVDRASRTVTVGALVAADGEPVLSPREIAYDDLVLAAGSMANDFGTPGVAEHCLSIDDLATAERFNEKLYNGLLRTAAAESPFHIAIVGAGATGVELAAEISQLLDIVASLGGPDLRPQLRLTLVESSPRILSAFPEAISKNALDQLQRLKIDVRLGTQVSAADAKGFILKDGTRIDAALCVWSAGVKAVDAISGLADFKHTPSGQIVIRSTLQSLDDDHVFALGDCASLHPAGVSRPLPPTAQVARQQAAHLGRHYPGWLKGQNIPDFVFRDLGALVSLGRYNAYGTLGHYGLLRGELIQGRFAHFSHAMLYRLHQAELQGVFRSGALWLSDALAGLARPPIRAA